MVIHRVTHTGGQLETKTAIERIREQSGHAQLHALQVVALLEQRRLSTMLDLVESPIAPQPWLELAHCAPVPASLLIQEPELERRIAKPVADLKRGAKTTLAEHVTEHHRAAGPNERAERSATRAHIGLANRLERHLRRVLSLAQRRE